MKLLTFLALAALVHGPLSPFLPTAFEATLFYGVGAPRNTPREIVDMLNRTINAGLAQPAVRERLARLDGMLLPGTSQDLGELIAAETAKWRKVIEAARIVAD